jgi:hypothetical protein
LIAVLAVATAALAVVCVLQSKQLRAQREVTVATEEAKRVEADGRETQALRVKELERSQARLQKQVEEFTSLTAALRSNDVRQSTTASALSKQLQATRTQTAGSGGTNEGAGALGKGMGEMLKTMMKDPAMRDMIREQQKATVKMMYSGLLKEMNLTPEEKEQFTQLLTDAQMRNVEAAQAMFSDKKEDNAAATQSVADTKKQSDADMKAFLGDERYAQYQDYQKNIGERMQLDQLKTSLAGQNMALNDQQSSQLLAIMKEEKSAVPPIIPSDANQDPQKVKALMTAENMDKQMQWMSDYNARVLARANQVLTADQYKQFQAFQEQQATMQRLGLKMAREMFSGDKPAPAATP